MAEFEPSPAREPSPIRVDVLVLGASFCGMEFVYRLRRRGGRRLSVAVVDRQARHPYLPLVHERVCAPVTGEGTTAPTGTWLAGLDAQLVEGELVAFDIATHMATLSDGRTISGRFVLVALGSQMSAPELPGAGRFSATKSADEIAEAERRLTALAAMGEVDGAPPKVVIVGGGISGVELAGELALARRTRGESLRSRSVVLVHKGPRLLESLGTRASRLALHRLTEQGVDVRLDTRVRALQEGGAVVVTRGEDEGLIACAVAFWAGGVRPADVLARLGLPRTVSGWLAVTPTLQCFGDADGGDPEIFAAGDAAKIQSGAGEWRTMQRAIEAIWQADVVARNVLAMAAEEVGYARVGVPPLHPHRPREDFFHGVSIGGSSLVVRGRWAIDLRGAGVWFRRWLMRRYFARYAPHSAREAPVPVRRRPG